MYNKIEKPWGYEEILAQNKDYVLKRLFMTKGNKCSLQFHNDKKETFLILSGKMKFLIGNSIDTLEELYLSVGDYCTIEPKVIHRMEAVEDCLYIETSTNFLDDVVRLQDDYNRS